MASAAISELRLAHALRAGDATAMRELFDRESPRIWSLVFRILGDYDQAQDVTQETFLRAFRKIEQFTGRGPLGAWLTRIAVNVARDSLKDAGRRASRHLPLARAHDAIADDRTLRHEERASLQAAMAQLPEHHRVVLLMHDLEGYSHDEIGAALGIAAGSSRARLSRARACLRTALGLTKEDSHAR